MNKIAKLIIVAGLLVALVQSMVVTSAAASAEKELEGKRILYINNSL